MSWFHKESRFYRLCRGMRQETVMLLMLIVVGGAMWGFAELADDVMEGDTREFDKAVLMALRDPVDPSETYGPGWLEESMRDVTALGGTGVALLICATALIYLILEKRWSLAIFVAVAVLGGMLVSLGLKTSFDRPRPELVPHGSIVYTRSFPSGHTMTAAVLYLTLGVMLARVQKRKVMKWFLMILAVVLTGAIGVSRVYLGVHWPTDVLAGWTAGAVWALLCWLGVSLVTRYLESRRTPQAEAVAHQLDE